jgi:hypothetical protein
MGENIITRNDNVITNVIISIFSNKLYKIKAEISKKTTAIA